MVYRIGTGEFTDSLMMDEVTGIGRNLIEHAAMMNNIMVELKTKSPNIDHLLDIPAKGSAVLAWSMNTERNIDRYEKDTSSLEERLFAAKKAVNSGYFVAFHFDPIILYDGWRDDYQKLIRRIFQEIDQAKTVWISLGCFRYSPSFKEIIRDRFPHEDLTAREMFPGRDGKMRYLKSRRRDVYLSLANAIREHASSPFIYLCMESADIWEETLGAHYSSSGELERSMSSYLRHTFLK
jgi:spore photoproduct lyase